jgi:hypothetical protein
MARNNKKQLAASVATLQQETVVAVAPRILEDTRAEAQAEAIAIAEIDHQIALPNSVVKASYKTKYKQRAIAAGLRGKAAKRSNGDWLSREMAKLVLDKGEKINIARLVEVCEANGLEDIEERWNNRSKGWEGRLRMTACLVLRKIVADANAFYVPGQDEPLVPPTEFVIKNETR